MLCRSVSLFEIMQRFDKTFLIFLLFFVEYAGEVSGKDEAGETYARRLRKLHREVGLPAPGRNPLSPGAWTTREGREVLHGFSRVAQDYDMEHTSRALARLGNHRGKFDPVGEFRHLAETITVDLELMALLWLRRDKAKYIGDPHPFGVEVSDRFVDAVDDICRASDCRGLELHVATVFHLMRALEYALRELARVLSVPDPVAGDRTWAKVLGRVRDAIDARQWGKGEVQFFNGAHGLLVGVRNAWRDDTMHVGAKYEEDDARRIYAAVEAFMAYLAKLPRQL